MNQDNSENTFDFIIIGSGFGGSVSAMRLAQKGYKVAILEMGKKYENKDFPKSNWNIFKYLWAPIIRCFGIQKITLLKKIMILHGIGVGGGSLVYANTLMKPDDSIFESKLWPMKIDWKTDLSRHFDSAKKMLGVVENPFICDNEIALKNVGKSLGVDNTFHATEVGVYFGDNPEPKEQEEVHDPFFKNQGPKRTPCKGCGGCMIGCSYGAKNSLDKNYLYFAQAWGAKIFPETKAIKIIPEKNGEYLVETNSSTKLFIKHKKIFKAKNVIVAAGVIGSIDLLLKNRDYFKTLSNISKTLGKGVRTNGESLLGATSLHSNKDFSQGIAIGAAIHPDKITKIEGVRYPSGSGLLRLLAVPLTSNGNMIIRPLKLLINCFKYLPRIFKLFTVRDWAHNTIILLVMQSADSTLRLTLGRFKLWPFKKILQGSSEGTSIPSYLPIAQKACLALAREIRGVPQNISSEVLLQTPATAHILGGAPIGDNIESGVVDTNHNVFNYPGLYVCDASIIPSNLAINPSLTITALAERFSEQFQDQNHIKGFESNKINFSSDLKE